MTLRKILTFLVTICMCIGLAACGSNETGDTTDTEKQSQTNQNEDKQYTTTLYADFSYGSEAAEEDGLIKTLDIQIAEPAADSDLAELLSEWTGLDFTINNFRNDGEVVYIDWSADSTLIAGLDDRELKEEFQFQDQDALRWFMMDSLRLTLQESNGVIDVCYTMDGGQELVFDELYPTNIFPSDMPYMGSAFYFAHADNVGDEGNEADFTRTWGTWRLDGDPDTAYIYMDGEGQFVAYYANGAKERDGFIKYVDEYDDGNGRYDLYDYMGGGEEPFLSIYFDSDTQFHVGNGDGPVYMLDMELAHEGIESLDSPPVLMREGMFTGLESLETNNDYNGGYLYKDMTEDGLTVIINTCFTNFQDEDESLEDYIFWTATEIGGTEPYEFKWEHSEEHTLRLSYPVYILSWQTGANEDTRQWDGFFFMTDTHTYLYAFDTAIDFHEEMQETWYDVFSTLHLEGLS